MSNTFDNKKYIKLLDDVSNERKKFHNAIMQNRLAQLNLQNNTELYLKPLTEKVEESRKEMGEKLDQSRKEMTDKLVAKIDTTQQDVKAIKDRVYPMRAIENEEELQEEFDIDTSGIDQTLARTMRPVFEPREGLIINKKKILVNPQTREMKVDGKDRIYKLTQELFDLIKGAKFTVEGADRETYGAFRRREYEDYYNLMLDVGASNRAQRMIILKRIVEDDQLRGEMQIGEGLRTKGATQFFPDDKDWMMEKLKTLIPAAKEGHTNVYNAGMAITERLHERGDISQAEYNNLIKIFNKK